MTHYKVESKTMSALLSAYPHTPDNQPLSIEEYLEDMWASGWELTGTLSDDVNDWRFVFKANGQP